MKAASQPTRPPLQLHYLHIKILATLDTYYATVLRSIYLTLVTHEQAARVQGRSARLVLGIGYVILSFFALNIFVFFTSMQNTHKEAGKAKNQKKFPL